MRSLLNPTPDELARELETTDPVTFTLTDGRSVGELAAAINASGAAEETESGVVGVVSREPLSPYRALLAIARHQRSNAPPSQN